MTDNVNIPKERYDLKILQSFRRITRSIDIYSKKLSSEHKLTSPQLICLIAISEAESTTISSISKKVYLSSGTLVGIIDRLEAKKLVIRERDKIDRRKVNIIITENGKSLIDNAPSPLQDKLLNSLNKLPELEQATIALSLDKVVRLMEAEDIEASPILENQEIKKSI